MVGISYSSIGGFRVRGDVFKTKQMFFKTISAFFFWDCMAAQLLSRISQTSDWGVQSCWRLG
jgi:hypothetical protein